MTTKKEGGPEQPPSEGLSGELPPEENQQGENQNVAGAEEPEQPQEQGQDAARRRSRGRRQRADTAEPQGTEEESIQRGQEERRRRTTERGRGLEEKREAARRRKIEERKAEIYRKHAEELKQFAVEGELRKEIQGILENQQVEGILIPNAKEWLKGHRNELLELASLADAEIDSLSKGKVLEYVRDRTEFWEETHANQGWKDAQNVIESLQQYGDNLPPNLKALILKRLPAGATSEKLWEKLEGENLNTRAVREAGLGTKAEYVQAEYINEEQRIKGRYFLEAWKSLNRGRVFSPDEERHTLDRDPNFHNFVRNNLEFLQRSLQQNLKDILDQLGPVEEKQILALLEKGYTNDEIGRMKGKKRLFSKEGSIEIQRAGGTKENFKVGDFQDTILKQGQNARETKLVDVSTRSGDRWEQTTQRKKNEILDEAARRLEPDIVNREYRNLERAMLARFLAGPIKETREGKQLAKKFEGQEARTRDFLKGLVDCADDIEGMGDDLGQAEDRIFETFDEFRFPIGLDTFRAGVGRLAEKGVEGSYADIVSQRGSSGFIAMILNILFEGVATRR